MQAWLAATSDHEFIPFSASHLTVLAVAGAGIVFLFLLKNRLKNEPHKFQWLRWTLLILLVVSEISYQSWTAAVGIWSFSGHVPLHLCGIASVIAILALLTWSRPLVQAAFYFGVIPAFLALITPELPYGYEHYRFWKFFVHHTAIPWACLFLALSKPSFITFRSVFAVFAFLLVYAAIIGFFINPRFEANYLYLSQLPTAATPLRFFGSGIWYYINLSAAALVLFLGQYGVWRLFIKKAD
ncbi:YwaF family protein [Planococcus lenghuensis]|uniref:ABC transporter permease n=1 Tax=Planococcus lenghuensis TaxID=2213202 RepID=A0A1Q2KUL2_9BACL|nr:TIGR02206 family membrane protein [Planococcus lenghuensis]AQQ51881.1 ABC transporter permease [Planococcus lenghuensis]